MTKYILIVYKPNSNDYCRGCHMASYSSDHEIIDTDDRSYVVDAYAKYLSFEPQCGEEEYEISLFCDSEEESLAIGREADIISKEMVANRNEKKRIARKAQDEKDKQELLELKRKQLEKLKKELEGSND